MFSRNNIFKQKIIERFFFLQTKNNNVIYITIDYVSNELIYNFKVNNIFNLLIDLSSKNYNQLR